MTSTTVRIWIRNLRSSLITQWTSTRLTSSKPSKSTCKMWSWRTDSNSRGSWEATSGGPITTNCPKWHKCSRTRKTGSKGCRKWSSGWGEGSRTKRRCTWKTKTNKTTRWTTTMITMVPGRKSLTGRTKTRIYRRRVLRKIKSRFRESYNIISWILFHLQKEIRFFRLIQAYSCSFLVSWKGTFVLLWRTLGKVQRYKQMEARMELINKHKNWIQKYITSQAAFWIWLGIKMIKVV